MALHVSIISVILLYCGRAAEQEMFGFPVVCPCGRLITIQNLSYFNTPDTY